ncbi:MAG: glycosyltransferase family 4 protein [Planctomycetota bacterium]
MKILFLTSRFPYPPKDGARLRTFKLIEHFAKNHEVHLASFIESSLNESLKQELSAYIKEMHLIYTAKTESYLRCALGLLGTLPLQVYYYKRKKMQSLINHLLKSQKYDLVISHLIRMTEYIKHYDIPKILEMTDAQSLHYARAENYKKGISWLINHVEKKRARNYEPAITGFFNSTVVVSGVDEKQLRNLGAKGDTAVIPNGVDFQFFNADNSKRESNSLLFLGNLPYAPNTDAALLLGHKIMPLIWKQFPDMRLYVVGAKPPASVQKLSSNSNIIVTGYVEDVREYYHKGLILAAPIRYAAGTQYKIIEAMACGCPVVTTSFSAEAINAVHGKHLIVAGASPEDFSTAVIDLFRNKLLQQELSVNARQYIQQQYDWEKILKKYDEIVEKAVKT